jgi:hypothetical protein
MNLSKSAALPPIFVFFAAMPAMGHLVGTQVTGTFNFSGGLVDDN